MPTLRHSWHTNSTHGIPLVLELSNGGRAEVGFAPISRSLPYAWTVKAADGSSAAGFAPSVDAACQRAEDTLARLVDRRVARGG